MKVKRSEFWLGLILLGLYLNHRLENLSWLEIIGLIILWSVIEWQLDKERDQ